MGQEALEKVVVEIVRSATTGPAAFAGVVVVNGHGGNLEPVERATATLRTELRCVQAWWPRIDGSDLHAGRTETSLVLAVAPWLVALTRAEPGSTAPLDELWPKLRRDGVSAIAPNGVLGDPSGAAVDDGRAILEGLVGDCCQTVESMWHELQGADR